MFQPTRTSSSKWLGLVEYREALSLQHQYELLVRQGTEDQILGLEHPHVITLGKRSKQDPIVPSGNIVWVDRGGEATLHSEGQLVIYPIVNLQNRFSVREWVEILLLATERTLRRFNLETKRGEHAGLWTETGKIAFAGIRVRNHVSTHGLAINVNNDLTLFNEIKSCGVSRAKIDSFKQQSLNVEIRDVFEVWQSEYQTIATSTGHEKPLLAPHQIVTFPMS